MDKVSNLVDDYIIRLSRIAPLLSDREIEDALIAHTSNLSNIPLTMTNEGAARLGLLQPEPEPQPILDDFLQPEPGPTLDDFLQPEPGPTLDDFLHFESGPDPNSYSEEYLQQSIPNVRDFERQLRAQPLLPSSSSPSPFLDFKPIDSDLDSPGRVNPSIEVDTRNQCTGDVCPSGAYPTYTSDKEISYLMEDTGIIEKPRSRLGGKRRKKTYRKY